MANNKIGAFNVFKGYIYILNGCSETDILQLLEIIWLNNYENNENKNISRSQNPPTV